MDVTASSPLVGIGPRNGLMGIQSLGKEDVMLLNKRYNVWGHKRLID